MLLEKAVSDLQGTKHNIRKLEKYKSYGIGYCLKY